MTKSQAVAAAKRHLSYGHYADGSTIYVQCPTCRERVQRVWSPLDGFQPHSRGQHVALRSELVEHLTDWCVE